MPIYLQPITYGSLTVYYTSLTEVKRILRTASQRRIRFGDSIRDLLPRTTNTGTAALSGVNMDPDFAATDRRVDITFSGAAAFSVTITDVSSRAQVALGSGTMGTNFSASDGSFVIPAANWSGAGVANDVISFLTDSHISVNDGLRFIQHAERMIDSRIGAIGGAYKALDSTIDRLFTVSTLPSVIGQATTYLAAYLIWAIIHSSVMTGAEDKGLPSAVNLWRKLAEDWVGQWMIREIERTSQTLPTWVARASLFNYVGLEDIGLGMLAETEQADIVMPEDRDDWNDDSNEYGGGD